MTSNKTCILCGLDFYVGEVRITDGEESVHYLCHRRFEIQNSGDVK